MPAIAPPTTAATPVAAMAAPTTAAIASHAICGSRHAGDCTLWEPACRRLHPPLLPRPRSLPWQLPQLLPSPALQSVGAGTPAIAPCGSRHAGDCTLWEPACRRLHPPLQPRPRSLPWQLPQLLPSPAMQSVGAGMPAIAPCGSRHAGDRALRYCRDPGRCHGSSHNCCHRQPCNLWEPACRRLHPPLQPRPQSLPWQLPQLLPSPVMQSVGADMPAIAPSTTAATPVAAMAAPTVRTCCHRQSCNLWEPACRRSHAGRNQRIRSSTDSVGLARFKV